MLDFNKKKNILKSLNERGKSNFLLFLPCRIAAAFVKLWFAAAAGIGIAFSDKNGNFLGIRSDEPDAVRKKQDDIVTVRRPVWARMLSAVLVCAFVLVFTPVLELNVSALANYVLDPATNEYYDANLTVSEPLIDSASCVKGYGSYKINWSFSDANTTGFEVYYKPSNGTRVLAKQISGTGDTSCIITGLTPTVSYTFSVVAVRRIPLYITQTTPNSDGTSTVNYVPTSNFYTIYSSAAEISDTPNAFLPAPAVSLSYVAAAGSSVKKPVITLTSAVSDADGYIVYRRNSDLANPTDAIVAVIPIASVSSSTLYTDESSLSKTTRYSYVVSAYKDVFGIYGTSAYDPNNAQYYITSTLTNNYHDVITETASPSNLKINTSSQNSIVLTWTGVPNATGYYVYRYTLAEIEAAGSGFTVDSSHRIADVMNATTYTDTDIVNKTTYYYYLSAYRAAENAMISESPSTGVSGALNTSIPAPQNFTVTASDGSASINWTSSDSAITGYELDITQINNADGTAVSSPSVSTINVTGTSYSQQGLFNGETYTYSIRAYKLINNVRYYSDTVGPRTVTIGSIFGTPQNISAVLNTDGTSTVKWSAVQGAVGYNVYITKSESDGSITTLPYRDVLSTTYNQNGLETGRIYSYYVIAYKYVNGIKVLSPASETVSISSTNYIAAPTDVTAVASDNSVTVSWTASANVTGYTVYAYTTSALNPISANTSKNSYTFTSLNKGTWSFYVVAYRTVNGSTVNSAQSNTVVAYIGNAVGTPADVKAVGDDGSVTVTWTAVAGAEGYIVYETLNGITTQYNVSKTTFTRTGLTNGTSASYQVAAYKTVNGELTYSVPSASSAATITAYLATPADFTVTSSEISASLSWSAVKNADGYIIYASKGGSTIQLTSSKTSYAHLGLTAGDTWSYYVTAYKTVNGSATYSKPSATIQVTIGSVLAAPTDFLAAAGDGFIDLSWSQVKNANGYVLYLYNGATNNYDPLAVLSTTKYKHTGLSNGTKYTYMVLAYKDSNGTKVYGGYSLAVSAVPSVDGTGAQGSEIDSILTVKGTAPYGISHSELISAAANHGAFDEPADAYFSTNEDSTAYVKNILKQYANGLKSFIIYPFDISLYNSGTLVEVEPNEGYNVTFTMPIPDKLVKYRDYITVVHVNEVGVETIYGDDETQPVIDEGNLEVLPSALIEIDGKWCIRFAVTSCSPFAFVIYKDSLSDISSGAAAAAGTSAGNFNTQVLNISFSPDIMPLQRKFRLVAIRKLYRIKRN